MLHGFCCVLDCDWDIEGDAVGGNGIVVVVIMLLVVMVQGSMPIVIFLGCLDGAGGILIGGVGVGFGNSANDSTGGGVDSHVDDSSEGGVMSGDDVCLHTEDVMGIVQLLCIVLT